ncbi:S8 family serine peptidase [Singulisphaera acidiphila]|uniref:Subtilisin-like serine protease n=1 Tax=Singulisphaera acidiphila (strain ATCC BAA-1392 / DSM 18658 / VKM B-2454 / MOB10) TaxID=886293 RepID=L0DDY3_SINAD|nr:S8 family serine peptidase [Singulisphaera acidiphila]AGA27589.1 subtilisin-like serine protease [Singulisphaera acidiphila DSM 18658]
MHILSATGKRVELEEVSTEVEPSIGGPVFRLAGSEQTSTRITRAARAFLDMGMPGAATLAMEAREAQTIAEAPPAVFRETGTGLLRVVYKEVVVRFKAGTSDKVRDRILKKMGLAVRSQNPLVPDQVVAYDRAGKRAGAGIVEVANACGELEEIVFATPNFVSEFRRTVVPTIIDEQWHLENRAKVAGQKKNEDVKAAGAWAKTLGKAKVVVAVLDDGIDVEHPNLKANIRKNPDPAQPLDLCGRDFFIPDNTNPEHFNPRPKLFQFPFDEMTGNDIHGTPCAGVIAAVGKAGGALGIAPKCRILAVKIFHADNLASDARVADAIRYAALHADILSCSWSGPTSPDIELAIQDAGVLGRNGLGSAVFCAAGNDFGAAVGFPASHPDAIAVGASTDQGMLAAYSNVGPELWVVAPSSGGIAGIFTTDVSLPGRGFNLGTVSAGGTDGRHTNRFGGTSSATPLAAGVAALVLSVKPGLTRQQLKDILAQTADRIGPDHNPVTGHSDKFGFGHVNAAKAVAAALAMP